MPKTKISEYSATNSANTDIEGINIDEGCPPSSINNAIRELMVHLKEFQTGASGDAFTFAGGTLMSGTNTISGAAVISGNINSSGTTNTFSGGNIFSGTNTFSGTNVFSSNVTLNAQSDLRFADSDSSNWVAFQAPATVSSNVTWTLPAADGTSNQALVTNGSGTLSFATAGSSLTGVTDSASPFETSLGTGAGGSNTGVNNTFVGYNAGTSSTTGTNNTAVGYQALDANTTGTQNTAVGMNALGATTTAGDNTSVGYGSLSSNTTGANNTALGSFALLSNTTASNNVAVGKDALGSNTTGDRNTAVGASALDANTTGLRNTANGYNALTENTTGNSNTALGSFTLSASTTADGNTAVGDGALNSNTTGADNTAVGQNCLLNNTTGKENTVVGKGSLQNCTTGSGNVGIGDIGALGRIFNVTTESNRALFGHGSITNAYVQVAFTVTSDARDKTNIQSIPHGLSFVNQLNPVSFQFRVSREDETPNGNKRYGFLAQEVMALEGDDPVIIDNEVPEKLKYQGESLVPVLVNAIKELSAKVAALEAQLATPPATPPAESNA